MRPASAKHLRLGLVAVPLLGLALSACYAAPAPPPPAQAEVEVVAPQPPPPLRAEVIPPPAPEHREFMAWNPGHWRWDGREWIWVPGHYVERPHRAAVWVPGHWDARPGGWVWIAGHWS